jgi:hypothetical protein
MQFIQQFNYELADGTLIDTIGVFEYEKKWLSSLSIEEQEEYKSANIRQKSYRQQIIDEGKMSIGEQKEYIWPDYKTMKKGKPEDPIWRQYFDRFLAENNMKLVTTLIPVV